MKYEIPESCSISSVAVVKDEVWFGLTNNTFVVFDLAVCFASSKGKLKYFMFFFC